MEIQDLDKEQLNKLIANIGNEVLELAINKAQDDDLNLDTRGILAASYSGLIYALGRHFYVTHSLSGVWAPDMAVGLVSKDLRKVLGALSGAVEDGPMY